MRNFSLSVFIVVWVALLGSDNALAKQSLLTDKCDYESIPQIFLDGHKWVDFPSYSDRNFWTNLPDDLKKIVIQNGDKASQIPPVSLTGYDYLLFKQGQTTDLISQKLLSKKNRLEDLVVAELVEGKGRFVNEICSSVWDFCALGNWTGPESQFLQTGKLGLPALDKIIVDELSGEIAGVLAWSYFFFEQEMNKVDPNIANWIVSTVRQKFLIPNLEKYDFFWMCYQSRHSRFQTPWISYNWLVANLLIEKDNQVRQKSIYKSLECLDHFYKSIPEDGACLGGPEIWQYSTGKYFQALEVLEMASVGEIDNYLDEKLKKMVEYIGQTYIGDQYFFNYAESSPKLILPAGLIFRMGEKMISPMLMGFGSHLAQQLTRKGILPTSDIYEKVRYLIDYEKIIQYQPEEPLLADVYLPQSQVVVARSQSMSNKGFFFALKGGNNGTFSNQNDAGSFVLYANGNPLVVDPGKMDRTAQSFGDERYQIWANQSSWHNLPTVNGFLQEAGAHHSVVDFKYEAGTSSVKVNMDLALTYDLQSGINQWIRTYEFKRSDGLEITDSYDLAQVKGETYVSFMVFSKPVIQKPGSVMLKINGQTYEFSYKATQFEIAVDEVKAQSDLNLEQWGETIYRIKLKPNSISKSGSWTYSFKEV